MRAAYRLLLIGFVTVLGLEAITLQAAPITYFDLNGSTFGGGVAVSGFGPASIVASANLDGSAFLFEVNDQMEWNRDTAPESSTHHVAFDYFAAAGVGANITFFLDVPSILRFDFDAPGRHHVDLYFDFTTQAIQSFVDGVADPSVLSIAAWPSTPVSADIRIANQSFAPGNSVGPFEIDNLLWEGNVQLAIPEPPSVALLGSVVIAFLAFKKKRNALFPH